VLVEQVETVVLPVVQMQVLEVQVAQEVQVVMGEHLARPELVEDLVVLEVQELPVMMALV
jgi:hypothetical protein